jgi:hypothetical protein
MYQTTTLPRPPRTLPGPQPGSETNVEGGGSTRAVTRLHIMIGLTGYRTEVFLRDDARSASSDHEWGRGSPDIDPAGVAILVG